MQLAATLEKTVTAWKREHTRELILPKLLVKPLAALTEVSKDTVPGYVVRKADCWKNTTMKMNKVSGRSCKQRSIIQTDTQADAYQRACTQHAQT